MRIECWELDAIPPNTLAQWVRDAVEEEIDWNTWRTSEERVKEEREKIRRALEQSSGEMDGLRKKGSAGL